MFGAQQTGKRHQPTLSTHPEDDDGRLSPTAFRQYSQPLFNDRQDRPISQVNRHHSYPTDGPSLSGFQPGLPGSTVRSLPYSARQTRDTRSQTGLAEEQNETENDTSSDENVDIEDDSLEEVVISQTAAEQLERLEWQTMLRSVLDGDVITSEKARVGIAEPESESIDPIERFKAQISSENAWLNYRGKLRKRELEEERKRVEHRRLRVGETLYEDILAFKYDQESGKSASNQINVHLRRLDAVESFYPHLKAMYTDRPNLKEPTFRKRVAAMIAWVNLAGMTSHHTSLLQKWTGSRGLDVMAPNTTTEVPIVSHPRYHNDYVSEVADDSTFVERVLKEQSLVQIFKKRSLVDALKIVDRANKVYASYSQEFDLMQLPSLKNELRELLTFPTKLMQASLRVQLDYANRIRDMDILLIDQMMEDFKVSISEACSRKMEYRELLNDTKLLDDCISEDYDQVVLEAVTTFFGLLHRKLKSGAGSRGAYLRETEFLDSQWDLLDKVASEIDGGSVLVAEQLCVVTHRLIVRITGAFEQQIRKPVSLASPVSRFSTVTNASAESFIHEELQVSKAGQHDGDEGKGNMVVAYIHMLEEARVRHRKLRRFAKALFNRFSNSAEYNMAELNIGMFIIKLVETGHQLVFSESHQSQGTYIVAEGVLASRKDQIPNFFKSAFQVISDAFSTRRKPQRASSDFDTEQALLNPQETNDSSDNPEKDKQEASNLDSTTNSKLQTTNSVNAKDASETLPKHEPGYLIVFRTSNPFYWHGRVIFGMDLPTRDLGIADQRLLLISEGGQTLLSSAKKRFASHFVYDDESRPHSDEANNNQLVSYASSVGTLPVQVDQRSHLPDINRELARVTRATNRLAFKIVESIHPVGQALRGIPGYQELLQNWFLFAAEHAHQQLPGAEFSRALTTLAISWVSFICDDCDSTDRRTFKWAVTALEFAKNRVANNVILQLPSDQFVQLRRKVAMCMSLLIRHFDILGARSSNEAKQARERQEELKRQLALDAKLQTEDDQYIRDIVLRDDETTIQSSGFVSSASTRSILVNRDIVLEQLNQLERSRDVPEGRVLDDNVPEDRTLFLLASSHANVSIRWQQGKLIGRGAFGSVYLASNMDTGTLMAVKEIHFQDAAGSLTNLYKSIKDELSVMEMLRHPNIVEYYGIEVHRDRVYIFEEYCPGGSLASLLDLGRIEDEMIIQMYALQMLDGLAYLHSRNVVHRDIKPDNILLDHRGVIKFVDFGASKIIARNRTMQRTRNSSSTAPSGPPGVTGNSLTGTPMYMSPEMIKNDRPSRLGAMDIWAMGCVILEAATGRKPWSNLDNEWAIMFHIGVATKHPPLPDPSQLSSQGIDFIRRCLVIDGIKRPTANDLENHPWILDIKDALAEDELVSGSQSPVEDIGVIPRQAAFMHDLEVEALNSASTSDGEFFSEQITPRVELNGFNT
ncbi:Suppressor of Sensor Kinase (SLN1) [Serendipita sp. 405]|nr:Suppressor of Sensor Kinase (SLN1) [Serendipita sp. 400]KAG8874222.1 Suppressor of Sensor Kinase (SLN1) [Serendipita sp. 405]